MYERQIFKQGPPKSSCFVLGPRQTGKTTLLQGITTSLHYDLLDRSEFLRLSRDSDLVFKECSALDSSKKHIVWIDEVQRLPTLLDAVQRTIDKFKNINFILSGSSARKLKQQGVNLLGGRALNYKLHPLTCQELGNDFTLDIALNYGTLPRIYLSIMEQDTSLAIELLNSYVSIYLEEEIKQEALVRELQPFQRFLEVAAQSAAQILNLSKVSDDSQVSYSAVQNYFSILEDTLIAFFLPAYHTSIRKQLTKHPKFYFFDNGVNRSILNTLSTSLTGLEKGRMFEQFVIQEVRRINDYYKKNYKLYFWRTESGAEVDLLVCNGPKIILAVECKSSEQVHKRDLSGLKSFKKEYSKVKTVVCAPVKRNLKIEDGFEVMSLSSLLELIHSGLH